MGVNMHGDKSVIIIHQSGFGIPVHISPKATMYFDLNTAVPYINKDGLSHWEPIGTGGGGSGISSFTYNPANNTLTILDSTGNTFTTSILSMSGLSVQNLSNVDYIDFNTGATVTNKAGRLFFDLSVDSLSYNPITDNTDVTLNIGQEHLVRVINKTGSQINNGKALIITGSTSGSPSVTLANSTYETNRYQVDGIATHDIPNNSFGFMTRLGRVNDINLTAFNVNDIVYLSDTVDGGFALYSTLNVTSRSAEIGHVLNNGVNGSLYVDLMNENRISDITLNELNILNGNTFSTGVFEFSGITSTGGTTFNVGPAKGWIVDNYTNPFIPTVKYVEFSGASGLTTPFISADSITYIALTSGATIEFFNTRLDEEQRRKKIFLGGVVHSNGSITLYKSLPDYIQSPASQLRDMFEAIRIINNGVVPYANGTNLNFNITAGALNALGINFVESKVIPNSLNISAQTPTSFLYRTMTGGSFSFVNTINPTQYDVGGVLTPVGGGSNSSTNQRIYLSVAGLISVQYGQTVYQSLSEAIANASNETFQTFSNLRDAAILIGILSVNKNATDLSDTTQARFLTTSKFGETIGASAGISTATLQKAYDNSIEPEIVTNSTLDGVTIRRGSASDSDALLSFQNGTGTTVSTINANGLGVFRNLQVSGLTSSANTRYLVANNDGYITYTSGSSIGIGSSILSGTQGSVLFINPTGILAQDNSNFNFSSRILTIGDGTTNAAPQIKFNYGTNGGGDFTSQLNGSDQMSFGFNNAAPYEGSAGVASGRNLYFYDRINALFRGNITATGRFYIGPSNSVYGLLVEQPSAGKSLTVLSTGYVGIGLVPTSTLHVSAATNPIRFEGLVSSANTRYLVANADGVVTYRTDLSNFDVFVTGGTHANGTTTFRNNTGGTFTVSGYSTGSTSGFDVFVTGGTFVPSAGTATFTNNTGGTFTVTDIVSTAATIYNSNGTITTGRTVGLSAFSLSFSSATQPNTLVLSGGNVSIGSNIASGYKLEVSGTTKISTSLRVGTDLNPNSGGIWVAGNAVLNYSGTPNGNTGIGTSGSTANRLEVSGTSKFSHSGAAVVTIVGSANSTTSLFTVQGSTGQMFTVTDNIVGSLFSVNDISGLPIVEVFSDDTMLVGNYIAMALNTSSKIMITGGTAGLIYSFPTSAYTGGFYDYTVSGASGLRAGNIMAVWSGTTTQMKETATTDIGSTSAVTFLTTVSADTLMLSASASSGTWIIKTIIRGI